MCIDLDCLGLDIVLYQVQMWHAELNFQLILSKFSRFSMLFNIHDVQKTNRFNSNRSEAFCELLSWLFSNFSKYLCFFGKKSQKLWTIWNYFVKFTCFICTIQIYKLIDQYCSQQFFCNFQNLYVKISNNYLSTHIKIISLVDLDQNEKVKYMIAWKP